MSNQFYLVDANIFLTPVKHQYYKFKIAPGYWKQFNSRAIQGYIKTIDHVSKELSTREKEEDKDDIQQWFEDDFKGEIINTYQLEIVHEFTELNQFIYDSSKYNEKAYEEWFGRADVADPWLIATAKVFDYCIVTFETPKIYSGSPFSEIKIPNVCDDLHIRYVDLFTMMEELKIIL